MTTGNRKVEVVVALLREVLNNVSVCHERAWWPAIGSVSQSRVGANTTRSGGAMLTPGDPPSMKRYHDLITDLNALRRDVDQLRRAPVSAIRLDVRTAPTAVEARIRMAISHLDGIHGVDDEIVERLITRASRLCGHAEAILSRPRVPASIPCKNAGERDLCTGWAINKKQQLCRSCENSEQYQQMRRRRRERKVRT